MTSTPLLLAAAILAAAAPAAAPPLVHVRTTAPGAPLVLGVESSGQADCTLGRISQTRIVTPPRHGVALVRQARVRGENSRCPGAPGYVVIYRSDPGFLGEDDLALEVRGQDRVDRHLFKIKVAGVPPAGAA
jgi:hypothetical protein